MKDKYYTPEISEFHVGFEYEEKVLGKWFKEEFDTNNDIYGDEEGITKLSEIYFNNIEVRVKYLNYSDLEELNWKMGSSNMSMSSPTSFYLYGENGITHWLNFWGWNRKLPKPGVYPGLVEISKISKNTHNTIFSGTIKNKSELKKLMKQLNIK